MLILTRNPNESIRIGDEIVITVLEVVGHSVRLGFKAPPTVAVHRQEIYDRLAEGEPGRRRDDSAGRTRRMEISASDAHDLVALHSLVRRQLSLGKLPSCKDSGIRLPSGPVDNCTLCTAVIDEAEMRYEAARTPSGSTPLRFHVECFLAWQSVSLSTLSATS